MLVGVDIGGTFTDVVLYDQKSDALKTWKVLTTPAAPEQGVLQGISEGLSEHGWNPDHVVAVVHATTLVTNAIIERKGERTAFVTTRGFRDTLALGLELRYDLYDLEPRFPDPLVPSHACLELAARSGPDGVTLAELEEGELQALLSQLESLGTRSLAVNLLHSYADPSLEEGLERWFNINSPDLSVSLSSDVAREVGEYERGSTVVANAYVKPVVERYLQGILAGLTAAGFTAPLYIMHSAGGFCSPEIAKRYPIRLLESGPAAGALAAAHAGTGAGLGDLLAFDMGGTTAKACLIRCGAPDITFRFEAGRVHRFKRGSGLPVRTPSVDLIEIGAGGGSIARIDSLGLVQVGPTSAGSSPGPACYGLGGLAPTVTDADLLLGYLGVDSFLGGRLQLDKEAALSAVTTNLTQYLSLSPLQAAWGVHQVVNENMAAAARIYLAEKGIDPRHLSMIATGGAGPVHAFGVARALGCRQVLYPAAAGVGSAVGLLVAQAREDEVQPYNHAVTAVEPSNLVMALRELESRARERLVGSFLAQSGPGEVDYSADMRFIGQGNWVNLPLRLDQLESDHLEAAYRRRYRDLYGNDVPNASVEFVSLRVVVAHAPTDARFAHADPTGVTTQAYREAFVTDAEGGRLRPVPLFQRSALTAGTVLTGPCLIEETSTTIVVNAATRVVIDTELNVVVDVPPSTQVAQAGHSRPQGHGPATGTPS